MNLFFNEVVAFVNKNPGITELSSLKEADVQKFEVSNIATILPRKFSISELTSIAPPYPNLWFEWVTELEPRLKFGVFLVSENSDEGWDCTFFFFNRLPSQRSPILFCSIAVSFPIPCNGRFSEDTLIKYFVLPSIKKTSEAITNFEVQFLVENFLALILFTLGLLHCKNIVLEERGGINPKIKSRRHRSKGTRHHVLQIMPGRETKRTVYEKPGKGSPHCLHFRRGHFKEYTTENPLFGKYTGVFWWEAHVAGKADIGMVTKDYQILPSEKMIGV